MDEGKVVDNEEEVEFEKAKKNNKHQVLPKRSPFACPANVPWVKEAPQTDLHIKSTTMTVLAMDGRRRMMDIEKLVRFLNLFLDPSSKYEVRVVQI